MDDQLATTLPSAMTASGPATRYEADPATTSATFTVKEKFGLLTATGSIPVATAEVTVDAHGLPRGTAALDVAHIDTHNTRRDKDLGGARFFDSATFPLLDFRSVSTRRDGDSIVVEGLLSVRGEECPLTLVALLHAQPDGRLRVHATGTFDRMTSPLRRIPRWLISPAVEVVVDAVLRPASPR